MVIYFIRPQKASVSFMRFSVFSFIDRAPMFGERGSQVCVQVAHVANEARRARGRRTPWGRGAFVNHRWPWPICHKTTVRLKEASPFISLWVSTDLWPPHPATPSPHTHFLFPLRACYDWDDDDAAVNMWHYGQEGNTKAFTCPRYIHRGMDACFSKCNRA